MSWKENGLFVFLDIVCLWNLKLALESILALSISALKMESSFRQSFRQTGQ